MDLAALNRAFSLGRLVDLSHPELPPAYVLCGKLIAAAWLLTGHAAFMPEVLLPVAPAFRAWPASLSLALLLRAAAIAACALILCSAWFRLGCAGLAGTIITASLASEAYFAHNRLYCAALLFALALCDRRTRRLPQLQAALLYGGAGLDKLLDGDWRTGVFLRSFASELAEFGTLWSPGRAVGSENFAASWLAHAFARWPALPNLCSLSVIALELGLCLAFARGSRAAVSGTLALHGMILLFTGSSFGMFLYAALASALLVAPAPRRPRVHYAWLLLLGGPWLRPWFGWLLIAGAAWSALRPLALVQPRAVAEERR